MLRGMFLLDKSYSTTYLPTYLPACLPACLPPYLPTYLLPAYLPPYLPNLLLHIDLRALGSKGSRLKSTESSPTSQPAEGRAAGFVKEVVLFGS